jgi:hypothetical protein
VKSKMFRAGVIAPAGVLAIGSAVIWGLYGDGWGAASALLGGMVVLIIFGP